MAGGRFEVELIKVQTPTGWVHNDNLVRADTSVEKLAKLSRCSPRTARSPRATPPLTDGASAMLLMSEEKAKALGKAAGGGALVGYVGVDPADQLLIGPASAMPKALDRGA